MKEFDSNLANLGSELKTFINTFLELQYKGFLMWAYLKDVVVLINFRRIMLTLKTTERRNSIKERTSLLSFIELGSEMNC